jgi:nucleoside-diphosphate-sugar epimerase
MMLHLKCERARVRMSLLLVVLAVVSLSLTPNHRSSLFNYCDAFQLVQQQPTTATLLLLQSQSRSSSLSSRRLSMSMSMSMSSSSTDSSTTDNSNSNASSTIKSVTVLGGTGFVGSRVCKILSDKGINVRSISKSGINGIPDWLLKEGITTTTTTTEEDSESDSDSESEDSENNNINNNNINWISLDILNVSNEELDIAMGQPDAIISCIGIIGTNPQQLIDGNGIVNVKGFESARRVSTSTSSTSTASTSTASTSTTSTSTTNNANNANALQSIAYVSVSSEVKACQDNWLPEFMESYFKAKNMAEVAALQDGNSQQDVTIVSPTFIYGTFYIN